MLSLGSAGGVFFRFLPASIMSDAELLHLQRFVSTGQVELFILVTT